MAMEEQRVAPVDEPELSEEELATIGNRFLQLIAPALNQGGQMGSPQQPMAQSAPQGMPSDRQLPPPQELKKFGARMAPKIKSVLQGYQKNMASQQRPNQMMPPQFMQPQIPTFQPMQPNIYNNLGARQQMPQGPYQAFNPYMVG